MRGGLLLVILAGCSRILGFDSATVEDAATGPGDTVDAPITCDNSEVSCPAGAPICSDGVCVECTPTQQDLCTGESPICGSDLHCRGCVRNDECPSQVCLTTGACASANEVAYVAQDSNGDCSLANPCLRIAQGMATGRPIIKVTGTVSDMLATNLDRDVEIYGDPGAAITRTTTGQILDLSTNAVVGLHDLAITGGTSTSGIGIRCINGLLVLDRVRIHGNEGIGLDVRGAELRMSRSVLFDNAQGGGRIENATFQITNSLIVQNGSPGSSIGGLRLKPNGLTNTLDSSTVADNLNDANTNADRGVDCEGMVIAKNTIVVNNASSNQCTFTDSLSDVALAGLDNRIGDPRFISTAGLDVTGFYRLGADSAAIDVGSTALTIDIDGDPRPSNAPDIGADERP